MKDAYSFDLDEQSAKNSYYKMFLAYLNTFRKLGLKAIPMSADTGPIGGDLSHEFIILAETGESKIYADKNILNIDPNKYNIEKKSLEKMISDYSSMYAATDEKHDEKEFNSKVKENSKLVTKGIEVGHIFYFGDKYSKPLNCSVDNEDAMKINVKMGSYGIGVSRLVGAVIEANYNNEVMKWPKTISPFECAILPNLGKKTEENLNIADKIYKKLKSQNVDVLLDDVSENMSSKFKKHDLIGIPFQIILGSKSTENNFEFKEVGKDSEFLKIDEIKSRIKE